MKKFPPSGNENEPKIVPTVFSSFRVLWENRRNFKKYKMKTWGRQRRDGIKNPCEGKIGTIWGCLDLSRGSWRKQI